MDSRQAQKEMDAIQDLQDAVKSMSDLGLDHEAVAEQIQEGYVNIGIQVVADIKVVGSIPPTPHRGGGPKKKPTQAEVKEANRKPPA